METSSERTPSWSWTSQISVSISPTAAPFFARGTSDHQARRWYQRTGLAPTRQVRPRQTTRSGTPAGVQATSTTSIDCELTSPSSLSEDPSRDLPFGAIQLHTFTQIADSVCGPPRTISRGRQSQHHRQPAALAETEGATP